MNFETENQGKVLIIKANVERLDTQCSPELKSIFIFEHKKGHNRIILDLKKTKFCDSSGLSSVLVANRLCKDTNGKFGLIGVQPMVQKMLEIAQLTSVIEVYLSLEEAIKHLE